MQEQYVVCGLEEPLPDHANHARHALGRIDRIQKQTFLLRGQANGFQG